MEKELNFNNHNLITPNSKELLFIDQFINKLLISIDKTPSEAKKVVDTILKPYLAAQLSTIDLLDDQIQGCIEQNALLLRSNAVLIDQCKKHGVAMPNFDEMARDVRAEIQAESDLGIKRY